MSIFNGRIVAMNKEQIMELAKYYMPVGIVDWSNQYGIRDETKQKNVKVYINLLEFEGFCLPDDLKGPIRNKKEMFMKIASYMRAQGVDPNAECIKGNTEQTGYFVRVGGVNTFDEYSGRHRPKSAPPPVKDRQLSIYVRVSKLNKNGLTDSEERLIKSLAEIIIRQNDKEIAEGLKNNGE